MSWEARNRPDGTRVYLVRWRDSDGRSRSKTVYRQRDAILMDADLKRKQSLGELAQHERGDIQIRDFYELWWERHALVNLAPKTREIYARLWRCHVAPAFGARKMRAIRAEQIQTMIAQLSKDLSPASVVRVVSILQNVLQRAVEWEYISTNPAASVRKPRQQHRRGRVLREGEVYALSLEFDQRSATVIQVLADTGLRPGELRALTWADVGEALSVTKAVSSDQIGPTKTRKNRSVRLRTMARSALRAWYFAQGQPSDNELVFPGKGGGIWTDNAYSLWSARKFREGASRAGFKGLHVYDLRHTFVSTLIAEGHDLHWIARQSGHSTRVMLDTYAHLIESVASEWDAKLSGGAFLRSSSGS